MTEKAVAALANKLAELVEIFRQGKPADDFHWWNENSPRSIFNPLYSYQDGAPLFRKVIQGVQRLNPEMLSEHEIEYQLVYHFLQKQTINITQEDHLKNQQLVNGARDFINQLVEFEAWQDVDIPIANLRLDGKPSKLGEVTFIAITEEELEQWKKELSYLWHEGVPHIHMIARVNAPGDQHNAISYAITHVNQALDIFRAFRFPFGHHSDTWRAGVMGDVISWVSTPMRINFRQYITQVGSGLAQVDLHKDILSKLEQRQWTLIDRLILKKENARSNMETKLLEGIHWLSESTKPDTNNSKFAKISFALETLIGSEPKDEDLKVRGITAMLAERAAFIAGRDRLDRLAIDKSIRTYYGTRSNIVHGGEGEVSLDDIDGFGQLVRRLALALLEKLDELANELSTVEKLEKWVKKQRYTLPNSEEAPNATG